MTSQWIGYAVICKLRSLVNVARPLIALNNPMLYGHAAAAMAAMGRMPHQGGGGGAGGGPNPFLNNGFRGGAAAGRSGGRKGSAEGNNNEMKKGKG